VVPVVSLGHRCHECSYTYLIIYIHKVKLSPEHNVTVEAGQDAANGPELVRIDRSVLGEPVEVVKTVQPRKVSSP
jgi:hypothetical protein